MVFMNSNCTKLSQSAFQYGVGMDSELPSPAGGFWGRGNQFSLRVWPLPAMWLLSAPAGLAHGLPLSPCSLVQLPRFPACCPEVSFSTSLTPSFSFLSSSFLNSFSSKTQNSKRDPNFPGKCDYSCGIPPQISNISRKFSTMFREQKLFLRWVCEPVFTRGVNKSIMEIK